MSARLYLAAGGSYRRILRILSLIVYGSIVAFFSLFSRPRAGLTSRVAFSGCCCFLTFSVLVDNPKKTTSHGSQSRSWSAEQGKKKKKKSLAALPPPPRRAARGNQYAEWEKQVPVSIHRRTMLKVCVWLRVLTRVCVCVFIKLHITAQSGPVILVILYHSH